MDRKNKKITRKRTVSREKWLKNVEKNNRHKPSGPPLIPNCGHNNERFQCATLTADSVHKFHEQLYLKHEKHYQDNFILQHLKTAPVKRHKNGRNSPTQRTSKYYVRNHLRVLVPVCIKTFLRMSQVSQFRVNLLTKKAFLGISIEEKRGGFTPARKRDCDYVIASIHSFLKSFEGVESHYCRGKTQRIYLPSELNISKLHKMYLDQVDEDRLKSVKESYFRHIFNTQFNFGFGSSISGVCSTCTSSKEKNKAETDSKHSPTLDYFIYVLDVDCVQGNAVKDEEEDECCFMEEQPELII